MNELFGLIGIPISLIGIYYTIKNHELSTLWQRVLSLAEIFVLVGSIAGFGLLWGSVIAGVSTITAVVITSLVLYMRLETILVDAAVHADSSKQDMFALLKECYAMGKAMKYLGQFKVAILIKQLAVRNRTSAEIKQMIVPISMLAAINHEYDLIQLVDKFDSILRQFNYAPSEAMDIADKLTKAMQISPMSFEELLQAFDAFGAPEL